MSDAAIDRFCPACGYNLRGIASDRCPECGQAFNPNEPAEPQIPWSHRKTMGRVRAFWRTVRLATFRTTAFASEVNRPVSLADALSFRRTVTATAFAPIAMTTVASYVVGLELHERAWFPWDVFDSLALWGGLAVLLVSQWLFLYFLFGAGSYFYHPASLPVVRQNRAIALSYYACAPWAYFLIATLIAVGFVIGAFVLEDHYRRVPLAMIAVLSLVCGIPILFWLFLIWFIPQRMLHKTTGSSLGRLAVIGFIVRPIVFVLVALATLGVTNFAYWLLVAIVESLR